MGFWKGAFATKKQKVFWVIFSIIMAFIAVLIIFALIPIRIRSSIAMKGGEWAHFYPDSFWHGTAKYSFETHPSSGSGKTINNAVAHVYNIKRFGTYLDFEMLADGFNVVIANNSTLSGVERNWNASILVTDGSQISVSLDSNPPLSAPVDFAIMQDETSFMNWINGKKDGINERFVLKSIENVKDLSASVTISSQYKYWATRKIYLGIKVTSGSSSIDVLRGTYYHSVAKVNIQNSTNFTSGEVEFVLNERAILQIDAPAECTSDSSEYCTMSVVIEPRWALFFGVVVIPVIVVVTGFVIGMMAIKALHVRQTIAMMRKKAKEEGIALEEGKSKDIHQERLDEANAEADMSEPGEEPAENDEEDADKQASDKPAEDEKPADAAVLTTSDDAQN